MPANEDLFTVGGHCADEMSEEVVGVVSILLGELSSKIFGELFLGIVSVGGVEFIQGDAALLEIINGFGEIWIFSASE
jgi:hypothetical protein